MADVRPEAPHALHDAREVRPVSFRGVHPVAVGPLYIEDDAGGADETLRRDATDIEAVAAEQVPLHQRHPGADARRSGGGHEPRGAGAQNHQVVTFRGLRISPVGRMDVGDEFFVVSVFGKHPSHGVNGLRHLFHGLIPLLSS